MIPKLKIKLTYIEQLDFCNAILLSMQDKNVVDLIDYIDYYNLKKLSWDMLKKQHQPHKKNIIFSIDLNIYNSLLNLYVITKLAIEQNLYIANLYQSIFMQFEKQVERYKNFVVTQKQLS